MKREFLILMFLLSIFAIALAQDSYPQRIISLGSSLTEELYLLGEGDKIVGVNVYCTRPPEAQTKEKVGTVIEINIEKIISLKPDLVLTTSLTSRKEKEKLERLGIRVVDFPAPSNFSEVCAEFLKLSRFVNKEKQAEEIIEQVKKEIDAIKENVKGLSQPKVFIQIGAKPLFAVNKDYFLHDFIEFAGGVNIAANAKTGIYSREKVIKDNPDIIIIATMGIVAEKEKENWLRFKALSAVKEKRIYIIDSYKICSPTPVTFVESLREIVEILHPKI